MGINLQKGSSINLSKEVPGLSKVALGAGWDVQGDGIDLDLWAVELKADGKAVAEDRLCYFGNKTTAAIKHSGDNLTGEGEGDDESMTIDFSKVSPDTKTIRAGVSFYNHNGRSMNVVQNAFVRVLNGETEVAKYDITGQGSGKTLYATDFVRGDNGWEMKAVGEYTTDDFKAGDVTSKLGL